MLTFLRFIFILIDKLLNVLLLGSPHKTISMRLAFAVHNEYVEPRYFWVTKLARFVDRLFHNRFYSIEEDHIYKNYEAEEILSDELWFWYNISNTTGYLNLKLRMMDARYEGRL